MKVARTDLEVAIDTLSYEEGGRLFLRGLTRHNAKEFVGAVAILIHAGKAMLEFPSVAQWDAAVAVFKTKYGFQPSALNDMLLVIRAEMIDGEEE
jgi:hypothetical protein